MPMAPLREVHDARAAVDEDDAEAGDAVDCSGAEPEDGELQDVVGHGSRSSDRVATGGCKTPGRLFVHRAGRQGVGHSWSAYASKNVPVTAFTFGLRQLYGERCRR